MSFFANPKAKPQGLSGLVAGIAREVNRNGSTMVAQAQANKVIAMESFSEGSVEAAELASTIVGLRTALENCSADIAKAAGRTEAQLQAGISAAVISANPMAYMTSDRGSMPEKDGVMIAARGGMDRLRLATEAYDEREIRNMSVYSIAYNLAAARQDEFGEAFFPTVTIAPDQWGLSMSIRLLQVYDQVRRDTSGADSKNFGKRNILQALIDPTLLKNDTLACVPVLRDTNEDKFVDTTLVAPVTKIIEGEEVTTSLLKFGKTMNLLSLGQTDALLKTGLADSSDTLDSYNRLSRVAVKLVSADGATTEVFDFGNLKQMQASLFTYAVQGNYRQMQLSFSTKNLVVNKNTTKIDGSASTLLADIVAGGYNVRLSLGVYGTLNIELGDINLTPSAVEVVEVTDKDGAVLSLTTGIGATIVDLFSRATAIGYDVEARRTNMNLREIGQALDLTYSNQVYAIPLLSPISIPRPLTGGDATDASDLAALITATHIMTSNSAVAKLLEAADTLKAFVTTNGGVQLFDPEIFGPVRQLVTPFYEEHSFDASSVQTLSSADKTANLQAELVNLLRDIVFRMVRDSGWKLVADAMAGGVAPNPTILIGTDPFIEKYLMVTGDFRLAGEKYAHKIVSTYNQDMRGKIFIALGDGADGSDGAPRPMHFGNMGWKPEITLILPIHRNGGNNKQLTVQPSYLHVVNVPVLAKIEVTGLSETATGKVAIDFHQVA